VQPVDNIDDYGRYSHELCATAGGGPCRRSYGKFRLGTSRAMRIPEGQLAEQRRIILRSCRRLKMIAVLKSKHLYAGVNTQLRRGSTQPSTANHCRLISA
jgi:hypothetical protein